PRCRARRCATGAPVPAPRHGTAARSTRWSLAARGKGILPHALDLSVHTHHLPQVVIALEHGLEIHHTLPGAVQVVISTDACAEELQLGVLRAEPAGRTPIARSEHGRDDVPF